MKKILSEIFSKLNYFFICHLLVNRFHLLNINWYQLSKNEKGNLKLMSKNDLKIWKETLVLTHCIKVFFSFSREKKSKLGRPFSKCISKLLIHSLPTPQTRSINF